MIDDHLIARIITFIQEKKTQELQEILRSLSGFEIAEIISKIEIEDQLYILNILSLKRGAEALDYLSERNQQQILQSAPSGLIASMLTEMAPDDRTALLQALPKTIIDQYVKLLPKEERILTIKLLGYPEDSVGRLMTTDFIAVKIEWTIEEVFDYIREHGRDSETIDVIYIVNDQDILIDDIRLKELLFHPRQDKIALICDHKFLALQVDDKAEEAIKIFREHSRVALPVINHEGLMLGIVTIDDILRLLSEEDTSEVHKIGGTEALDLPYTETPFFELVKKRARWLVVLFLGEMFTATAMGFYEKQIAQAVVLALFLPLIISSGGNAGSQSSTLIIRAMALGEIKLRDWWKIMRWELLLGASLGLILGLVGFARVTIWNSVGGLYGEHWLLIATTIFLSLIGVVLWGSLAGAMLPFLLRSIGFDPATSSAPLVATLVDVVGIIIYFTMAIMILRGTLL